MARATLKIVGKLSKRILIRHLYPAAEASGLELSVRQAVNDMIACPSKPSKRFKPINPRPYNCDVGNFSYVGGQEAQRRYFACPGRAFVFLWLVSTGRLKEFLFQKRKVRQENQDIIRRIIIEYRDYAIERL